MLTYPNNTISKLCRGGNLPPVKKQNKEKDIFMKATGIVRRIDDLGRVVIPKEIRRTMRIREGDPLEIFTAPDGEVIFKKYSPVGELSTLATQYAEVLYRGANSPVLICDRDRVIACAGIPKKEVIDRQLTQELEDYMERREMFTAKREGEGMTPAIGVERKACIAAPIIAAGDVSGAVVLLGDEKLSVPAAADIKLVQVAANFLGRQMEE